MEDLPLGLVLSLLVPFHVAGGAALGIALRNLFQGGFKPSKIFQHGFFLVWGSMFGGIPLAFGLALGAGWVIALQLCIFVGTIAFVILRYPWLRDLYSQPGMFVATFGLGFFVVGIAVGSLLTDAEAPIGLLLALIFGVTGAVITGIGVWLLLRSR